MEMGAMTSVPVHLRHQFDIDYVSEMDGQRYEGKFTCKKLSIRDMGRMQVRKIELNGGYHYDEKNPGKGIDEMSDLTNMMISHLEVGLIQSPVWFNLEELYDVGLISEVFKRVAEFETSFSSPTKRAAFNMGSRTNDSGKKSAGTGNVGSVTPVGGGEVPTSLEP